MLSTISIVYLAVLAGCALAGLLTAVMFLIKKKANKSLALYAVCVIALLGLGYMVSRDNPLPNPRYTEPEPVIVSPGTQHPSTPWPIAAAPEPVESEPVDIPVDPAPVLEPAAEPEEEVPTEPPVRAAPVAARSSRSNSSTAAAPAAAPTPAPQPESVPAPAPVSVEPTLMEEAELAPMSNPTLVDDPTPIYPPEPQLVDE